MDFELNKLVTEFTNTNKEFERTTFKKNILSFTTKPISKKGRNPTKVNIVGEIIKKIVSIIMIKKVE